EGRRAAAGVRLQVLLDRELDVLRRELAKSLVELHAGTQLERPRLELVRGLPFGGEPGAVLERLRIALDERIVDAVPQRLLRLGGAQSERRLGAPLPDGDGEAIACRAAGGTSRREDRSARDSGARRSSGGALQERPAIEFSGHGDILRQGECGRMV